MRFRHLYIDSKYRTTGSDSGFSINHNESVETAEGARCWVAGATFANVFYTIEEGVNDQWYVAFNNNGVTGGYALKLAYGNYGGTELAAEMQAKLRTVDQAAQVSYVIRNFRLQIVMGAGRQIKVVSDAELTNGAFLATWAAYTPTAVYDPDNPRSMNEVIRAQPVPMAPS